MANLQFLSNVLHGGRWIKGPVIKDNVEQVPGMVIDMENDPTNLKDVAQNLIDRKLAKVTNDPATHTTVVVNAANEPMPVTAPSGAGQAPAALQADAIAPRTPDGFPQKPAAPAPQAPAQPKQPTPEEVAAAAAAVN